MELYYAYNQHLNETYNKKSRLLVRKLSFWSFQVFFFYYSAETKLENDSVLGYARINFIFFLVVNISSRA